MDDSAPYPTSSRRRLTRTLPNFNESVTTASSAQAGPSRLPELTQLVDAHFSEMDRNYEDTDTDDNETPRISASSNLPGDTPAARLRALLSRVPNRSTSPAQHVPPPPTRHDDSGTDYESDFDKGESYNATTNSVARESLRDVFSRALRDPGDTPLKAGRRRSSSVDASDADETPRGEVDKGKMKGKRKSLSDEEIENSHRTPMPSVFKSRAKPLTMEVLEQRYMNSQSDRTDDEFSSPNKREEDEVSSSLMRDLNSSAAFPPAATSTPQQSLRMSVDLGSQYQQSNLLDQNSEMHRLINGIDSYDDTRPEQSGTSNGVWFPGRHESTTEQTPRAHDGDPEADFSSNPGQASTAPRSPRLSNGTVEEQPSRQRVWSFPRGARTTSKRPDTTTGSGKSALTSRSLAALNGRKISQPRHSGGSSRSGSFLSDVEQRDRIRDLEDDILRQRERRWNKTPRRSSMTSLQSNSPQSAERQRTRSDHGNSPRNDSPRSDTNSPSTSRPLRRYNSMTSNRSLSPNGSIHSVQTEDEGDPDFVHLRERNWNHPRPVWPFPVAEPLVIPGINSNGSHSPHSRARARTMSVSSAETDDAYNPRSYTSPTSTSGTRYTPNGTPSKPNRRHASSPSLSQQPSRIPQSPSTIRKRASAANLSSPHNGQDGDRIRPKTISMNGLKADSPSSSKSLSASPGRNTDYSSGIMRPTKIPVRSPRRAVPVPSTSASGRSAFPKPPSSGSEWDDAPGAGDNRRRSPVLPSHLEPEDDLRVQELTPTLRTVAPPPSGSLDLSHEASSRSLEYLDAPQEYEENGLNDSTATVYAGPRRELPTIIDSPPKQPSSSLRLEFASPSPPKNLPSLPDPPSTDDEGTDGTGWQGFKPARLFDENKSILQTPKAPGAWFDTPAPARRPRSYSDTTLRDPRTSQDDSVLPSNLPNYSTLPTPRPPGGWLVTPAPAKPGYVEQSVETDTEPETGPIPALQTGLVTPSSSLSKGSRYPQTPAAPGAWVNTPAGRKSVMKVRFDPDANETREFTKGESDASGTENLNSSTNSATQTLSPPDTPELEGQKMLAPKKAPSIRVLDAYGNERQEEEPESPTKQSSFRLGDALGEAAEDLVQSDETSRSIVVPSESRDALLSRVRRGLDELVSDMHDVDRASALSSSELTRVNELDSQSIQAREKRRRLSREYKKDNSEFKERFDALRNCMDKETSSEYSPNTKWHFTSPRFFFLILLQIALAIIMYRLSDSRVEELFKTAYYDPFQPYLYQHIFKSRLLRSQSPEYVSWLSLLDLLRDQGVKACARQTRDNLSISLSNIQSFIWERFGDDGSYLKIPWPPT